MKKPKFYRTPEYISDLSEKIIAKRGGRFGDSLRDAADKIGISAPTLSRIERGAVPDLGTFRILCQWLGESADALLKIGDHGAQKDTGGRDE